MMRMCKNFLMNKSFMIVYFQKDSIWDKMIEYVFPEASYKFCLHKINTKFPTRGVYCIQIKCGDEKYFYDLLQKFSVS